MSFFFQLTPVEKYAMKFLESSDDGWAAEAERIAAEIEQQKKEWELGRLQALREEEERMAHNSDEDLLTFSSADAHNQVNMKKKKGRGRGRPPSSPAKKGQVGRPRKSPAFKKQEQARSYTDSSTETDSDTDDDSEDESLSESDIYDSDASFNPSQKKIRYNSEHVALNRGARANSRSLSPGKSMFSKVAEDSPRTRSRGRVKINLWTLDVNPLLPGEKPVPFSRKQLASFRDQGLAIPTPDGSISPSLSEDRSRSSSVQAVNGDMGREEAEVGEDMDVDVVGDSGDSNTLEGARITPDDGDGLEDVTTTLKTNGPAQITVQNGLGL